MSSCPGIGFEQPLRPDRVSIVKPRVTWCKSTAYVRSSRCVIAVASSRALVSTGHRSCQAHLSRIVLWQRGSWQPHRRGQRFSVEVLAAKIGHMRELAPKSFGAKLMCVAVKNDATH
jgi:hypothetical protein